MKNSVEITKEAAWTLIGNDEPTWADYEQHETHEVTYYVAKGVRIAAIHNYVSEVTQYFLQDVNA